MRPQPKRRILAAFALGALAALPVSCRGLRPERRWLDYVDVVDLTYPFDERAIYWPTSPTGFKLEKIHAGPTPGGYYYSAYSFCAPEHGGTHFDAPAHFAEGRWTADRVPVERLMGPCVVIDVSRKAESDRDYRLTAEDVTAWEGLHGRIQEDSIVLLRTGWGKRWPDRKLFLGDDRPLDASNLHFPSYGREAAELLVKERKVSVLGVDTASIDHGPSKDFVVHRIANEGNVAGLENIANLELVPETGAFLIALPMKIAGGSGGPTRIAAFVPR